MAYRISFSDPNSLPMQIADILHEQIDSALAYLQTEDASKVDDGIHEARKCVKKTRSLLRLVGDALSEHDYKKVNRALRSAGRALSSVRDAQAMIEAIGELPETMVPPDRRQAILDELQSRKQQAFSGDHLPEALQSAKVNLQHSRETFDGVEVSGDIAGVLLDGALQSYKRGRSALKTAQAHPTPDHMHRLRKRVKDYWYQSRLLSESVSVKADHLEELNALQDILGECQNLIVLEKTVEGLKGLREDADAIRTQRKQLSREARAVAAQVYTLKPKQLREAWAGAIASS